MFVSQPVVHHQRVHWAGITHVRLKPGAKGDTAAGRKILNYISTFIDADGVAEIAKFQDGFPAVRTHRTKLRSMQADLRHMANARDSGSMEENKGILEIGSMITKSHVPSS